MNKLDNARWERFVLARSLEHKGVGGAELQFDCAKGEIDLLSDTPPFPLSPELAELVERMEEKSREQEIAKAKGDWRTIDKCWLWYMDQLGMLSGMWRRRRSGPRTALDHVSDTERSRRLHECGFEDVLKMITVVITPETEPTALAAACMYLDYALPDWRERLDFTPGELGFVIDRRHPSVFEWRRSVLERDGHACKDCGSNEELHAHHVMRWVDFPTLRLDVDNGLTLCRPCHNKAHRKKTRDGHAEA